jgi:large subunit ribosomal protein L14
MIQQQTIIKVSDNSGAKTVRCIKILNGFRKKYAKLGDVIVVSVQQLRNKSKKTSRVQKKKIYQAMIIKTKAKYIKKNGCKIFFKENSVILLNKQGNPIGTRILSPIPKIFRKKKFQKIISMSTGLI